MKDIKAKLYNISNGYLAARSLHVAAYYKLFDELMESKTADQIASSLKLNPKNLKALLMVLANHDIINIDEEGFFSLNSVSEYLVSDTDNSLQAFIAKPFEPRYWNAVGNIHLALENNVSPFEELYGESFYEYLDKNEKAAELFNKGMAVFSESEDKEVTLVYDYSKFDTICDVGGGTGSLIHKVLLKHTNINGILFDLKSALQKSLAINDDKLQNRLEGVVGNFFEEVPRADAYLIKRVLHNWDNEKCLKILKNCLSSLNNKKLGRIFVIEKIMPKIPDGSLLIDGAVLSLAFGAVERSLEEFIDLGKQANLNLEEKINTKEGVSVLVFISV